MSKTRFNFPCNCDAYDFPHRIGSGGCNGSKFALFYFINIRNSCNGCNCNCGSNCDVADQRESVFECEAAINMNKMGHQLIPCSLDKLYRIGR